MANEKKVATVAELKDKIERSTIAIATEYRGLSVSEMGKLRRAIKDAGVEIKVVKNRLFLRAAEAAGKPELTELLEGPTAVVFGYGDITVPAKTVTEYQKSARNAFAVRKAVLDGKVLTAKELEALADLPPREVLIGQLAGALQSPLVALAGLIENLMPVGPGRLYHDTMRTFTGLLEARAAQVEGT